ncbi:MAG: aminodeoxychorismate/anthranilate synthase component II [Syntrophomonadaceae bacterium]|nr:aminodeoxychorismate/anthranilate synthase component II [Syntrophomonadaceae bacterium]MDD3889995.1 aminodeoxychorismate/anthranilate synthase component II [Syntrophomonadaceae bacterium]MDD4550284.1 aminodeoxychorismate/anthranilate synthase component II [Syntrophomonadaceae bacterium]
MILMIDNYDSFTYNLVQYFEELGQKVIVKRNDKITIEEITVLKPDYICISPGPSTPNDAGISLDIIEHFAGKIPILGICLGHQAIAQVFGGEIVINWRQMHGKTSPVIHDNRGVFSNLPNPLKVVRYHSLVVDTKDFPATLEITARTPEGEIMGLRHKELPLEGVQFHPESILSEAGHQLLQNFLNSY